MKEKTVFTVLLYGFVNLDDDDREVCIDGKPDGWTVWLRRDFPNRKPKAGKAFEPFDSDEDYEADFASLGAAKIYAIALATKFETIADMPISVDEY